MATPWNDQPATCGLMTTHVCLRKSSKTSQRYAWPPGQDGRPLPLTGLEPPGPQYTPVLSHPALLPSWIKH